MWLYFSAFPEKIVLTVPQRAASNRPLFLQSCRSRHNRRGAPLGITFHQESWKNGEKATTLKEEIRHNPREWRMRPPAQRLPALPCEFPGTPVIDDSSPAPTTASCYRDA
jgi:hypothetical protein